MKNGVVTTPPCYLGALEGITRQAIIDLCDKLGIKLKEEPFSMHDVYIADEVFLLEPRLRSSPLVKLTDG